MSGNNITVTKISVSEIRVVLPIASGKSCEWRLQKNSTTGVWVISSLFGVVGSNCIRLSEEGSTFEYANQIGLTSDTYASGSTYDFYGGGHGSELCQAISMIVDGSQFTSPTSVCDEFIITQSILTKKPVGVGAGNIIGASTLTHRFSGESLIIEHSHAITASGLSYRTAYGAMLPGYLPTMNRAQCDGGTIYNIANSNIVALTGLSGKSYSMWHSDPSVNPFKTTMEIDLPEISGVGWTLSAPPQAWFWDGTTYPKWYANWIADTPTTARASVHKQKYTVTSY